jgi:hypothetical protein
MAKQKPAERSSGVERSFDALALDAVEQLGNWDDYLRRAYLERVRCWGPGIINGDRRRFTAALGKELIGRFPELVESFNALAGPLRIGVEQRRSSLAEIHRFQPVHLEGAGSDEPRAGSWVELAACYLFCQVGPLLAGGSSTSARSWPEGPADAHLEVTAAKERLLRGVILGRWDEAHPSPLNRSALRTGVQGELAALAVRVAHAPVGTEELPRVEPPGRAKRRSKCAARNDLFLRLYESDGSPTQGSPSAIRDFCIEQHPEFKIPGKGKGKVLVAKGIEEARKRRDTLGR